MRLNTYIDETGEVRETFDHLYNSTSLNERGVELAEVCRFLSGPKDVRFGAHVLEIGNVLSHYPTLDALVPDRVIVDLYEQAAGVINEDILSWEPVIPPTDIIAISTLEHIGTDADDDPFPARALHALMRLRLMLPVGGRLFATWPQGHNACLDDMTRLGFFGDAISLDAYARGQESWVSSDPNSWPRPYGETTMWAEAVTIAVFGPVV